MVVGEAVNLVDGWWQSQTCDKFRYVTNTWVHFSTRLPRQSRDRVSEGDNESGIHEHTTDLVVNDVRFTVANKLNINDPNTRTSLVPGFVKAQGVAPA